MPIEETTQRSAPTLEAVAAVAGVSRSTVSRVVNGSKRVKPEVVAAVLAVIESLHYVPNQAARSLANRRSMAVALVVPEDSARFFGDPYFASIVEGIISELAKSDYVLVLQLARSSSDSGNDIRYLLGGNVDGALVVSQHSRDSSLALALLGGSLPVVFNGRPLRESEPPNYYVDVDNSGAAESATKYLISIGRKRIATIAGPPDMAVGIDRTAGWRKALSDAGLPSDLLVSADFSRDGGAAAMVELLERYPDLDGVFAASDLMATGAVSVLLGRGISVPGAVAVVGFDNSAAATSAAIPLTTMHQPAVQTGAMMAEMMLALLRGEQIPHQRILPTRLIIRESA